MDTSYKRLAEVENGDLVVVLRDGTNHVAIKGEYQGTHLVVILTSEIDGAPGPYTLMDLEAQWSVVTLGGKWIVDFDPLKSIATDPAGRPPMGSMSIMESGLSIVTHNESGPHWCSVDGQIRDVQTGKPYTTDWRILIKECGDQYKEIYRWPEEDGDK